MSERLATSPAAVTSAGISSVGVAYGMARYGFGLLAPDIRAEFGLSSGTLGLLAAASYVAYLITCVAAGGLTGRLGPRAMVVAGGLCAVVGMAVAGLARSPATLFAGLLVAGASAGLVFPPFSAVAARTIDSARRPRLLAAVSSGTGWGVAVAAPIALACGTNWRAAWLSFAALAAAATVWAVLVLPGGGPGASSAPAAPLRPRWFLCPRSGPLLAGAGLVGVASSVYWTFGADHVIRDGDLTSAQSRLFLAVVGVASVGGTVAGDAVRRVGGRATFAAAAAAEAIALALLGSVPGNLAAVLLSAGLFGAAYNVIVAVAVIWSGVVFAERPGAGLAAVVLMNATGLLLGPPVLGAVADRTGFGPVFAAAGVLMVALMSLAPREELDPQS